MQESYNDGNLEMVWKVKWRSECEYEIICQKVLVSTVPIKPGDRIVAAIIKTEGDCFTTSFLVYNEFYPEGFAGTGEMCIKKD